MGSIFLKICPYNLHLVIEVTDLFAQCFMKIDLSAMEYVGAGWNVGIWGY